MLPDGVLFTFGDFKNLLRAEALCHMLNCNIRSLDEGFLSLKSFLPHENSFIEILREIKKTIQW
jgi:hypothetical protein